MSENTQSSGPGSSSTGLNGRPTLVVDRSNAQEHSDTQRSLQQASVALEVAYNRIRQVRRSLLQLSDSLPNTDNLPRFSANYNEVRPGHEALLLSGDSRDNPEGNFEMERDPRNLIRLLASVPPPPSVLIDIPNLEQAPILTESRESQGVNESFTRSNESDPLLFQPISLPNVLPPRFSRREFLPNDLQHFPRRGINSDSASTLRGLRVAAREANGREARDDILVPPIEFDRISGGETDGDSVLNGRGERQMRVARNLEGRRAGPSPPLPPPALPSWRLPDPRRWRRLDGRTTSRPFSGDAFDRLNSPFNMSDAPFSQPLPRNLPRFPLPNESRTMPSSYEQYRSFQETVRPDDAPSNVVIDWSDEEFISWLFHTQNQHSIMSPPRQPMRDGSQSNSDAIRITRTTDTAVSPSDGSPPRRGWARLDPDGNEIPAIEEEELERSRTAYRLQALQRTRQNAVAQTGSHPNDAFQIDGGQRVIYGSVLDSTLRIQEDRHQHYAPDNDFSPLYVDPLPMPLSSMNPEKRKEIVLHDIFVPQHAGLAGR